MLCIIITKLSLLNCWIQQWMSFFNTICPKWNSIFFKKSPLSLSITEMLTIYRTSMNLCMWKGALNWMVGGNWQMIKLQIEIRSEKGNVDLWDYGTILLDLEKLLWKHSCKLSLVERTVLGPLTHYWALFWRSLI